MSGAQIKIANPVDGSADRPVTITGSAASISLAEYLINARSDTTSQFDQIPHLLFLESGEGVRRGSQERESGEGVRRGSQERESGEGVSQSDRCKIPETFPKIPRMTVSPLEHFLHGPSWFLESSNRWSLGSGTFVTISFWSWLVEQAFDLAQH
jgi:hypothetical protein